MSFHQPMPNSNIINTNDNIIIINHNNNNNNCPATGTNARGPNLHPNPSFNKKSNNAQGGQLRASAFAVSLNSDPNNASVYRLAPNASLLQPPKPALGAQTTEKPAQASAEVVQKPPSQAANVNPDIAATPTKAPGDASKPFAIQFGSVSSGTLNGMLIPARTSSAPPSLVEQQKDQTPRDVLRQAQPYHIPSVSKQQTGEAHQIPKARNDIQVLTPYPVTQTEKNPIHNISGISRPMPFLQHVPIQFRGPTSQLQSQPIPMPLPMGSGPQLSHAVYVPGLHSCPHLMQPQGIIHQGQGYNFTSQMGQQMPLQLGNMGMGGAGPQFPQLQPSNTLVGSRVPVKITDPTTREELRLENASLPSSRPINYYPNPVLYSPNSTLNASSQPLPRPGFPVLQTASSHKPADLESYNDVRKAVCSVAPDSVHITNKPAPEKMNELVRKTSSVEETALVVDLSNGNTKNDQVNKQKRKEFPQPSHQVFGQSTVQSVPSQSLEHLNSFDSATSETPGARPTDSSSSGLSIVYSTLNLSNDNSTNGEPLNLEDNENKGGKVLVEGDKKDDNISNALSKAVDETEMKSTVKVGTSLEVKLLEVTKKDKEGMLDDSKKANVLESLTSLTPDVNENTSNTSPELTEKAKEEGAENVSDAGLKEKPVVEPNRSRSSVSKGKKKRKEFLQKADAAGTTSDLYNANKGPEGRKELEATSEKSDYLRDLIVDFNQYDVLLSETNGVCKLSLMIGKMLRTSRF